MDRAELEKLRAVQQRFVKSLPELFRFEIGGQPCLVTNVRIAIRNTKDGTGPVLMVYGYPQAAVEPDCKRSVVKKIRATKLISLPEMFEGIPVDVMYSGD